MAVSSQGLLDASLVTRPHLQVLARFQVLEVGQNLFKTFVSPLCNFVPQLVDVWQFKVKIVFPVKFSRRLPNYNLRLRVAVDYPAHRALSELTRLGSPQPRVGQF